MFTNFGQRSWNHDFRLDPIVRSRIDNDFYKQAMNQVVVNEPTMRGTRVTMRVINRTTSVLLADELDIIELREQLDNVRQLPVTGKDIAYLAGSRFFGQQSIFSGSYLDWFGNTHSLPDYNLEFLKSGQLLLETEGPWEDAMHWEIPMLSIISELRSRAALRKLGEFDRHVVYAKALSELSDKLSVLKDVEGLALTDFGTRRRHGFLWQEACILACVEKLGPKFLGTSNMHIAGKHGLTTVKYEMI